MLFNNEVPKGFKILSECPVLVIEYHERESLYPIKFFLTVIVIFLTLSTFIIVFWLSIEPLSILQNRIGRSDFWQFQNGGQLYFDENRFSIAGLIAIIFALFMPFMLTYELIWSLFGISRYIAFPEKLIVKHQLLGMSQTSSILRDSLLYFKQSKIRVKHQTKGWTLSAIKTQKKFFFFRP